MPIMYISNEQNSILVNRVRIKVFNEESMKTTQELGKQGRSRGLDPDWLLQFCVPMAFLACCVEISVNFNESFEIFRQLQPEGFRFSGAIQELAAYLLLVYMASFLSLWGCCRASLALFELGSQKTN